MKHVKRTPTIFSATQGIVNPNACEFKLLATVNA